MNRFVVLNDGGDVYSWRSEKAVADEDAIDATTRHCRPHGVYELLYTVTHEVSVKIVRSPAIDKGDK